MMANCCSHQHNPSQTQPHFEQLAQSKTVANGVQTAIRIQQMDCPTEEGVLRKKFATMNEVQALEFNLIQRVLTVTHGKQDLPKILEAIRSLGFEPELPEADGKLAKTEAPQKPLLPSVIAGVLALGSEAVTWFGLPHWSGAILAVAAVLLCGIETYKKGWLSIRTGSLNINALMSIAVTGGLLIGQWPEAAMVMVLFTLAEVIEAKSLDRARNAIAELMALAPETATVQQPDGSWQEMAADSVSVGDVVRVKPGERIALDGNISQGQSAVNQAPITGESLPVDKGVGDQVFAGTINQSGSFEYQVTAAASHSTLARIIHAVEEAQGVKAPTQRFVDKFAQIYTPAVLVIALLIAVIPPLFMAGAWFDWIYKALVLLVIACPCALVISTPVTVVSGLAAAARKGILIKGGVYLEQGRLLTTLALDKTGTLTHGKPVQTNMTALATMPLAEARSLAVSLAARSDHPVSQAIATANPENSNVKSVENFTALLGRGVQGQIDGTEYILGNIRLIEERKQATSELQSQIEQLEKQGKTVVVLADNHQVLALFAVADTVKESSRQAIAELHQLGVKTLMLTGDNQHTANAIAAQVGIDEALGNQLPQDKLNTVQSAVENQTKSQKIGMVGDGINDAPALARADIGFAMGAMGTDTAIETADVALMDDDLGKIPEFIYLSKNAHAILMQNISFALLVKAVFLALTLGGIGTMWMAVFADVGASLLVVGNGLRLLRK
ncbi:heavy metal translocating P-type ATPase [Testudinibacter sp. TR-2022]|uniref:heavy metal translocating P-type ATPase n=1 Tax=Testudinibacter sp. TR-2022 TaxID=2585029 RepID=UPI00111A42BA|nr:heavy metal translocating P-type ATPase [Testudinibacter sp. TR-2022]TNH07148.1 heavy metal translocating P-type ATPase [Pasteurellaceae bacterium Phil11]TNH20547.1 heavy metal translocating P-type ATPase [Testudinibacter sp. TR-2022]TNH29436.1 heavy metal translocating P-type ATPase [Testudinibacter sp. TR-2022]